MAPALNRPGGRWAGRFLTVAMSGGTLRADLRATLYEPFTRATGCHVTDVSLPPERLVAELRRQFFSGRVAWDAVVLDAPRLLALARMEPQLFARPPDRALPWRGSPSAPVPAAAPALVPLDLDWWAAQGAAALGRFAVWFGQVGVAG